MKILGFVLFWGGFVLGCSLFWSVVFDGAGDLAHRQGNVFVMAFAFGLMVIGGAVLANADGSE